MRPLSSTSFLYTHFSIPLCLALGSLCPPKEFIFLHVIHPCSSGPASSVFSLVFIVHTHLVQFHPAFCTDDHPAYLYYFLVSLHLLVSDLMFFLIISFLILSFLVLSQTSHLHSSHSAFMLLSQYSRHINEATFLVTSLIIDFGTSILFSYCWK